MNTPEFMTKQQLKNWLEKDPDGWAESHNEINLKVKGARTPAEYVQLCMQAADNFDVHDKLKCIAACKAADDFFDKFSRSVWNQGFDGIDFQKLCNMKWKLACFEAGKVEEGCPHTRQDIIFIDKGLMKNSNHKDLTRIMVHEKIHVYERAFPGHMSIWMKAKGFKRWRRESDYPRFKNNPDLDGWVYLDPDGREGLMQFKSMNPKDFWDQDYPVKDQSSSEHPYETLAYILDHLYWALNQDSKSTIGQPQDYVNKFYNISAIVKHR